MRTESEVKEKFDELYTRELQKKYARYLTKGYRNCRYNNVHRVRENGRIGFCHHPEIANTDVDGTFTLVACNDDDTARKCKCFECKNTEKSVLDEFLKELQNPSECGKRYPKIAVLLWFLQRMPDTEATRFGRVRAWLGRLFGQQQG